VAVKRVPYHDAAQICVNGHVITSRATRNPHLLQDFCDQCGEPTIVECPNCGVPIRGADLKRAPLPVPYTAPSFCPACGTPYPWTKKRLMAAQEYADELEGLNEKEKSLLMKSLDDITRDTPQTEVAAVRIKKLLAKVGPAAAAVMQDMIVKVATESAKKVLFQ
jgi:hypothetical protein